MHSVILARALSTWSQVAILAQDGALQAESFQRLHLSLQDCSGPMYQILLHPEL